MSVLQEEARVRLRLEDRIRQLEESLRTSTDENKKLQKRVDMMVSVFPEIEKHSDLAAVLRDRDDEIRRLKGAAVFERDVQPVVRVCSCDQKRAAAQKTISDLRAQLEAANARIKLLEPLMVNEPAARRKTADERVLATMWREENGVLQAIHDEVEGRKIADKRLEAMMYAGLLP